MAKGPHKPTAATNAPSPAHTQCFVSLPYWPPCFPILPLDTRKGARASSQRISEKSTKAYLLTHCLRWTVPAVWLSFRRRDLFIVSIPKIPSEKWSTYVEACNDVTGVRARALVWPSTRISSGLKLRRRDNFHLLRYFEVFGRHSLRHERFI